MLKFFLHATLIKTMFDAKIQKGKRVQMFPKKVYMFCVSLNQTSCNKKDLFTKNAAVVL